MTLDEAIELLEITEDIDKITDEKLREKRRRAMQRWHPDTVPLSDSATKERYEYQFKNIEVALGIIAKYRAGEYFAGQESDNETASQSSRASQQQSEMSKEAPTWQFDIQKIWQQIRAAGWNMTTKETVYSDGFSLRDVLRGDLKDDIMAVSVMSIFNGYYGFLLSCIPLMIFPYLIYVTLVIWAIHTLLCFLLILPLSRIWMWDWLTDAAIYSCNKGIALGELMMNVLGRWKFFRVLLTWPFYFAKGLTLLVIMPLYELVGYFLGDKRVGVKIRREKYFADFQEAYVSYLLTKVPSQMSWLELRHLSEIHQTCLKFR
jgi:hypothetical protein